MFRSTRMIHPATDASLPLRPSKCGSSFSVITELGVNHVQLVNESISPKRNLTQDVGRRQEINSGKEVEQMATNWKQQFWTII